MIDFNEEIEKYTEIKILEDFNDEIDRYKENDLLDLLHYIVQNK